LSGGSRKQKTHICQGRRTRIGGEGKGGRPWTGDVGEIYNGWWKKNLPDFVSPTPGLQRRVEKQWRDLRAEVKRRKRTSPRSPNQEGKRLVVNARKGQGGKVGAQG